MSAPVGDGGTFETLKAATRLRELERRMTIRLGAMIAAAAGIVVAALEFLHAAGIRGSA